MIRALREKPDGAPVLAGCKRNTPAFIEYTVLSTLGWLSESAMHVGYTLNAVAPLAATP